jgi:hypothetical protein
MEELLNPMKKSNDEMEEIYNPMKSLINSINPIELPKFGYLEQISLTQNAFSMPSYMTPFEELQKNMEYNLNPLKKLQDEMEYMFNPLARLQHEISLVSNPFKELEKALNPMKSVIESLNSLNSSLATANLTELGKVLKDLNVSSFKIQESVQKDLEEQIDSLTNEDKKTLDEVIDSMKHIFPDIDYLSESFSKGKYIAIIMYILFSILPDIYIKYENYAQNIISDSYYKINRNKVRVRTEPSTENSSTIIMKLNKNVFVEKIDSHKNWLKIEFEDEEGKEIEGWVRRDMLTKIED